MIEKLFGALGFNVQSNGLEKGMNFNGNKLQYV